MTRSRCPSPAWRWLAALLAAACDIGAPVVDELPEPSGGIGPIECRRPPVCKPLVVKAVEEAPVRSAEVIELDTCVVFDPGACVDPSEAASASGASAPSEGAAPACHGAQRRDGVATRLECAESSVHGPDEVARIELENARWTRSNLRVTAERPLHLEITRAAVREVFVQLTGPVTLRLEDAELRDLRVRASASAAGRPRLELVGSDIEQLTVGADDAWFEGEVVVRHGVVAGAVVYARDAWLESSAVSDARVAVEALNATDVIVADAVVRAELGLVSAFEVARSQLEYCQQLKLVAGQVLDSHVFGCEDGAAQIYETSLQSSALEGRVELDLADLEGVRLGVERTTEIVAFGSSLSSVALCREVAQLAIGPDTQIECSECDASFIDPPRACTLEGVERAPEANFCALLDEGVTLPVCEEPGPSRTRPVGGFR